MKKLLIAALCCLSLNAAHAETGTPSPSSSDSVAATGKGQPGVRADKAVRIVPNRVSGPKEPSLPAKPRGACRILSYNIRGVRGMDNKTDYKRTAQVIKDCDADVVALQEVDKDTARSKKTDQAGKLGELTGMEHVFAKAIPYQGGEYGIAVLSREKPIGHKVVALPGSKEQRALLIVEFPRFVFCCTHFDLTRKDRIESAKIVNNLVSTYEKPVFLAGDLNAGPNSETIRELRKEWAMLTSDSEPTFPADRPNETIDYIFGCKDKSSSYKLIQSGVVSEPAASDHRPIFADITFRK